MSTVSVYVVVISSVFAIIGGLAGAVVFLIRYALLPWLIQHLVIPLQETRHQVKVNQHASDEPTVLDRIEDVGETAKQAVHVARENAKHAKMAVGLAREALEEIHALSHMFDGHLEWSQGEVDKIWKKLRGKEGIDK